MEKKLDEIKKELRILHLGVYMMIDIIDDRKISKSLILNNLYGIYVRLERLINKINTMKGE